MANISFNFDNIEDSYNKYLELCKKGQFLIAVKKYKEDTGCSMSEAKNFIDNLRVENGLKSPTTSSSSGCMAVITGAIIIVTSTFLFL